MNENIFNKLATWLSAWQHQNLYENLMNEIIFIWQDRNIFVYNQIKEKVKCKTTNININKNNYGDYYV